MTSQNLAPFRWAGDRAIGLSRHRCRGFHPQYTEKGLFDSGPVKEADLHERPKTAFQLAPHQVPAPPVKNPNWTTALRWVVMVADQDSNEFRWACRLIHVANDGRPFSKKQGQTAQAILAETTVLYRMGALACQQDSEPVSDTNVVPFAPHGRAS